jgi:hypothetical protein
MRCNAIPCGPHACACADVIAEEGPNPTAAKADVVPHRGAAVALTGAPSTAIIASFCATIVSEKRDGAAVSSASSARCIAFDSCCASRPLFLLRVCARAPAPRSAHIQERAQTHQPMVAVQLDLPVQKRRHDADIVLLRRALCRVLHPPASSHAAQRLRLRARTCVVCAH